MYMVLWDPPEVKGPKTNKLNKKYETYLFNTQKYPKRGSLGIIKVPLKNEK